MAVAVLRVVHLSVYGCTFGHVCVRLPCAHHHAARRAAPGARRREGARTAHRAHDALIVTGVCGARQHTIRQSAAERTR
jgi:hypothetical protein